MVRAGLTRLRRSRDMVAVKVFTTPSGKMEMEVKRLRDRLGDRETG